MILSITSRELQVAARCLLVSPWFRASRIPWRLVPIGCAGRTPVGTTFGAVPSCVACCSGESSALAIPTGTFPVGIDSVPVEGVLVGPWARDVSLVAVVFRLEDLSSPRSPYSPSHPCRRSSHSLNCPSFPRATRGRWPNRGV